MKKKIIIGVFLSLILITAIAFFVGAVSDFNRAADNDDVLTGLGSVMLLCIGGYVVFYEMDLFYTVYYFFIKPKTIAKSILNVLSNLVLLLVFFSDYIGFLLYRYVSEIFRDDIVTLLFLICLYVLLRTVCAIIPNKKVDK